MPELPEVETVRRSLAPLVGREVVAVEVISADVVRGTSPQVFRERLVGRRVSALDRQGKYLLIRLQPAETVLVHLRMTGRLCLVEGNSPAGRHTHLRITLSPGGELRYDDQRRFGGFWLLGAGALPQGFSTLGPDALLAPLPPGRLRAALARRTGPIKAALLDQRLMAGVGNIYADEALFRAALHPGRPANSLRPTEVRRLLAALGETLREAVENHGTTIADFLDGRGEPGLNAQALRVYGRSGLPCEGCGAVIQKIRVAGRGTHVCPVCQHLAEARERG